MSTSDVFGEFAEIWQINPLRFSRRALSTHGVLKCAYFFRHFLPQAIQEYRGETNGLLVNWGVRVSGISRSSCGSGSNRI